MPLLDVPPEVDAMVAAGSYELHSTLDVMLGSGEVVHLSTVLLSDIATIDFGTVAYNSWLREVGTLSQSLTLANDGVDIRAQNVLEDLGTLVFGEESALDGASGIFSYVFINDADEKYQVEILHGMIVNAEKQGPDMTFKLVSHLSTDGALGGYRTLQNHCFNRYKIDPRCASLSPLEQGCDKTEDGPNGCSKHLAAAAVTTPAEEDNRSRHTGFLYHIEPRPGAEPSRETGVVDGGDDFNSYWRTREEAGGYVGRHHIPEFI